MRDLNASSTVGLLVSETSVAGGSHGQHTCANAVGGQYQDAVVVLEGTEEHGYQSVSLQVFHVAFLEEDICLIQKYNYAR